MKVAMTIWQGRIAPVFDVSRTALILDPEGGEECREATVSLPDGCAQSKLLFLKEQGVGALICGAMTRRVREQAEGLGIRVSPFISGDVREIRQAWNSGGLEAACYTMPGCGRCRRRRGRCADW